MSSDNIYSAPRAVLEQTQVQYYEPKMMSLSGRIGRVRYFAYVLGVNVLSYLSFLGLAAITSFLPRSVENVMLIILMPVGVIALIVYFFSLAKRRLNDINLSGWYVLFGLIPIINIVFGLVLIFWPGNPAVNRFGAMPSRNNSAEIIASVLGFFGIILGILAAIATPA